MKRRTKIVCTLGPAVASRPKCSALIAAGMNVARLNCSHGDWETKQEWIKWVRELSPAIAPVAVLADLQGPKFRLGELTNGELDIKPGQLLLVGQTASSQLCIPANEIFEAMATGDRLLLGDGDVELRLMLKVGNEFQARAISGGTVKSRQGVTLRGKSFDVPAITDKDRQDIYEACKAGVDFIALSYVRRAADLRELRRLVDKYDPSVAICAKIETREALRHLDEIVSMSDVVMVARGDLGLQMEIEDVPLAQKRIIARCGVAGKPVITATQMLESMIHAPRPTRAEATDVANAILDGTDAVMLSGETASGLYPLETVKTMSRIAEKAESLFDYRSRLGAHGRRSGQVSSTEGVAHAAATLATELNARAIMTTSTSGQTPRLVSKFRPPLPIYCASWNRRTQAQLAIVWGVESIHVPVPETTDETVAQALDAFLCSKRLRIGDTVVVTAGVPPGTKGNTNLILVQTVK